MKGLDCIPTQKDLQGAYESLQGLRSVGPIESQLALWSQWSRFDPRLAEQWVQWVAANWKRCNPLELRKEGLLVPWPAAVGALLEHCGAYRTLERRERQIFLAWARLVAVGFPHASGEQFFIGLRAFAGKAMRDDARLSLTLYSRWGYLSREILINKSSSASPTRGALLSKGQRRELLNRLLAQQTRITVADYLKALDGCLGLRQAEKDLRDHPRLKPMGQTRGRFYVKTGKRRVGS